MAYMIVDLQRTVGGIKPLHGVNNGPVTYGSLVDVSDYYHKAGIPLVRLHDPNWPHPREVDVHIVFPDFECDPDDPDSYDFSRTDEYIRTVLATGARIVYRLGESIEHTAVKYHVHPPRDYDKWVRICLNIIRHYNEGWANGFHHNIEYWEIWNEPDYSDKMWTGTHEQYYRLYEAAAPAIKKAFPHLKVGGPAAARPMLEFVTEFLAHCRDKQLPLDFFSWHTYTADPEVIARHALHVREQLDRFGFDKTESHLNEWNYLPADFAKIWLKGNEYMRRDVFERQKSAEGAAFVGAVLSKLHDLPVDAANYYDGQPTALFCGLFDIYGVPQKAYRVFEAFRELLDRPHRVAVEVSAGGNKVYGLAGKDDDGRALVMISHFHPKAESYELVVRGVPAGARMKCAVSLLNDEHDWLPLGEHAVADGERVRLDIPGYAVVLARLSAV